MCWLLCAYGGPRQAIAECEAIQADNDDLHAYGTFEEYGKQLPYLTNCLNESLRIYTPVPVLTREAVADDELCGMRVPAGTRIAINCWSVHHDPKVRTFVPALAHC